MLSRWPIRRKVQLGISLLLLVVTILAISGFCGVYAYRRLAKSLSQRAAELPLATRLIEQASALREAVANARQLVGVAGRADPASIAPELMQNSFDEHLQGIRLTFAEYRRQIDFSPPRTDPLGNHGSQRQHVIAFGENLDRVVQLAEHIHWWLDDQQLAVLQGEVESLYRSANTLPTHLHDRMQSLADSVRYQYRTWIVLMWISAAMAAALLAFLGHLFYRWVFSPLRMLIHGSRRVAGGDFRHVIRLRSDDEMAELARALNDMTRRFCEIRDDLDRQVQQRTREVIRSEQLASVGFLAAGVAHEINNPLASIALCAESLEDRLHDIVQADDLKPDEDHNAEITILKNYLRMIQDESFRCKQITERLLDFSRLGHAQRQTTDLTEVVRGVIEMLGHLGKYKQKTIGFEASGPVLARVNSQEMKQVVLNLITNGLDSLEDEGSVRVTLRGQAPLAMLVVEDDGCGMTDEVKQHIFEPFFTRRRDGQGTGLGMSIAYRIISDHGGTIDVHSDGPGKGSRFTICLPLSHEPTAQPSIAQAA